MGPYVVDGIKEDHRLQMKNGFEKFSSMEKILNRRGA
jgi:hypothetical protein